MKDKRVSVKTNVRAAGEGNVGGNGHSRL